MARDGVVLREEAGDASQPQAARLPGDLMSLLEKTGITLPEVDVFAVATGPGSFTGLRIGIATMQGLAFAERKPLIGVSGFDALERSLRRKPEVTREIATWVDAWRGEVYAALYKDGLEVIRPAVEHPDGLLATLGTWNAESRSPITFIGDGADTYRNLIGRTLGDRARIADPATPLLAGVIAQLANEAASTGGHLPPPHAIRPLYVRRPDAELARAQRAR